MFPCASFTVAFTPNMSRLETLNITKETTSPYLNLPPRLRIQKHSPLPRRYVLIYYILNPGLYEEWMSSHLDPYIFAMASNPDLSSDELRSQTSLRIANYWLQFATNHIDMAKWATNLAAEAFTEASASAPVQTYEAGSASVCNAGSPGEAKLVATYEGYSEYSGLWEKTGNGLVAKKLVFSAEAVAAMNRLTCDANAAQSAEQVTPASSNPQVGPANIHESLPTPSQLSSAADRVNSSVPGPGYQITLPFRPRHQASVTTCDPALTRLSQSLESYRRAAIRAGRELEKSEEQVGHTIEGLVTLSSSPLPSVLSPICPPFIHTHIPNTFTQPTNISLLPFRNRHVVDHHTRRHPIFKYRNIFVAQEAQAEERRKSLKADQEKEATRGYLLPGFQGHGPRPAERGMQGLAELSGEDERR